MDCNKHDLFDHAADETGSLALKEKGGEMLALSIDDLNNRVLGTPVRHPERLR